MEGQVLSFGVGHVPQRKGNTKLTKPHLIHVSFILRSVSFGKQNVELDGVFSM